MNSENSYNSVALDSVNNIYIPLKNENKSLFFWTSRDTHDLSLPLFGVCFCTQSKNGLKKKKDLTTKSHLASFINRAHRRLLLSGS